MRASIREAVREAASTRRITARRPSPPLAFLSETWRPQVLSPQAVIELQRSAGNASVSGLVAGLSGFARTELQREAATAAASPSVVPELPNWSDDQLADIQRELRRLRLYRLRIDRVFGPGTEAGLVEAFGGNEWRTLEASEVLARLQAAKTPPKGRRGEHELRYGELFKDGILDMTVGLGFTEELVKVGKARVPYYLTLVPQFEKVLGQRGFKKDTALAEEVLADAGRDLGTTPVGEFFVHKDALIYSPPAGDGRSVHVVVRLLVNTNPEGGAGDVAAAFTEGMVESDVAYYTGHGRYGSGPDFDRNFERFELLDRRGKITRTFRGRDYERLGHSLAGEGKAYGRSAWDQFLWRVAHKRINVITSDLGNVYLNPKRREREFGANLIYWALERDGVAPVTGKGNTLEAGAEAHPEHKYHVDVFDGCRTKDYETSIHGTPGYDEGSTDIIETTRTVGFLAEATTFAAFLDSLIHQRSAERLVKEMNSALKKKEAGYTGPAFKPSGMKYDPMAR